MMIRRDLKALLEKLYPEDDIVISHVPKDKEGDYSTNLALIRAAREKSRPLDIAHDIARKIKHPMIHTVTVHRPGFVNFEIDTDYLIKELFTGDFSLNIGNGTKVLVEYVSANPTGPLNIVSARAAAVGNALVNLLNVAGFEAASEYYVNDSGRQTDLLAESIRQRMIELDGGAAHIPPDGYHGEYLVPLARELRRKKIADIDDIRDHALHYFQDAHKRVLEEFGVSFTNWVRESGIRTKGCVDDVLRVLDENNLTYLKDGARWLRTGQFGDKDDRVLVTREGRYTYLLPDIAYHLDKITRGHTLLIDIWGPDHQAQIKSLESSLAALGYSAGRLKVLIVQQVQLRKGGKVLKMSKRAGTIETLEDLLVHVPQDVVKFFMLMRSNSQHLDFDLDLAVQQTDENPVYYVQYAHARIKSIIRKANDQQTQESGASTAQYIIEPEEIALAKTIAKFPEVLEDAVRTYEPYMIAYYLIDLARAFHYFYGKCRVIGDDHDITRARIALIQKTADVLQRGMTVLGISCPDRM
jgi:arginyl-tRNA synthetase